MDLDVEWLPSKTSGSVFVKIFSSLPLRKGSSSDNHNPVAEVVPEHSKALEAPEIDPLNHSN